MSHPLRKIAREWAVGAATILVGLLTVANADADVLNDLTTQRHWIGYAPRNFNPNIGLEPSQQQIRADLEQLHAEGWRSIYTYSLDGVLQHVPRIAKEVGFEYTLAGAFFFNQAQLNREKTAAQNQLAHIDGFIVGNEGLAFGRYTGQELVDAVEFFQGFGKPVTTTEISGLYFAFPELLDLGDFAFYNSQPWFNASVDVSDPAGIASLVSDEYFSLKELRPDRPVIIKESWWPTSGHPEATEANQVAFFEALHNETDSNGDSVLFAWGEAYDQPWKSESSPFGTLGPDWGFHTPGGTAKQLIAELQDVFTSQVPSTIFAGDYNADGTVDAADYTLWRDNLSQPAGTLLNDVDGGPIGVAQYNTWRANFGATSAAVQSVAVPEPNAAWLVVLGLGVFRRRVL